MDILNHYFIAAETEDQRASTWTRGGRQLGAPNFSAGSATPGPTTRQPAAIAASRPRSLRSPEPLVFASASGRSAPSLSLARCRTSALPSPPNPGVAAHAQACPYWEEVSKTGQACLILTKNNNLSRSLRSWRRRSDQFKNGGASLTTPVFRFVGSGAKVTSECAGTTGRSYLHGNPRAAQAAWPGGKCGS